MQSELVVKRDVIGDGLLSLKLGKISTVVNFFSFECMKKRLDNSIVIAVSLPAHTGQEAVLSKCLLEISTGILTAPI